VEEGGVSHLAQASARREEVEAAHSPALPFAHSAHGSGSARPLSQAFPAFLACTSLDIAPLDGAAAAAAVAASPPGLHTSEREVSMSWSEVSCSRWSDRPNWIRSVRIASCWRRRILVYHSRQRLGARSSWTGLRKMVEEFVGSLVAGRQRSDYLQIVVASQRSYLSSPVRGTRLRRGTIRRVLTSSHNTRLRQCRPPCTTSSQNPRLFVIPFSPTTVRPHLKTELSNRVQCQVWNVPLEVGGRCLGWCFVSRVSPGASDETETMREDNTAMRSHGNRVVLAVGQTEWYVDRPVV
jgi:hypothetical protein